MLDLFLHKGNHFLLEDYGRVSYHKNKTPYMILADGCSSGENTDIGARILTLIGEEIFNSLTRTEYFYFLNPDYLKSLFKHEILSFFSKFPSLSSKSLLSTFIMGFPVRDEFYITMFGDGLIIFKEKNGDVYYIDIRYTDDAPYYLLYECTPVLKSAYQKEFPDNRLQVTTCKNNKEIEFNLYPYDQVYGHIINMENIEFIAISTDGISKFYNPEGKNLPIWDVIQEFTSFKNHNRNFVKRRLYKAIEKFNKIGFVNEDDIGFAVYYPESN